MGHTIANFRVFVNVWISAVFANKFWRPRPLPPRVPARFRIRFARARPARGRVGLSGRREMGHTIANFRVFVNVWMIEILQFAPRRTETSSAVDLPKHAA